MSKSKGKILFQLSGSIAAFKACEVISSLVKDGFEVEIVATKNALRFVGEATFEGLSGRPIHSEVFQRSQMMDHIHLVRWADLIVLCPASAKTINHLAAGTGDSLVSTLFLAHDFKKPYFIAPAMNHSMYHHPIVQESLGKLQNLGTTIIEPESGALACGENGEGRLAHPQRIFSVIANYFTKRNKQREKILITFGGTEEPIDGVRSISNFSSGQTGAFIANYLSQEGFEVTTLQAKKSLTTNSLTHTHHFQTFDDLEASLKDLLSKNSFHSVIHLAAVSDFSVDHVEVGGATVQDPIKQKIPSDGEVSIHLKRNKKLISEIKSYSQEPERLKVIGFKLTHSDSLEKRKSAVQELLEKAPVDYVVHNDIGEINAKTGQHRYTIFDRQHQLLTGQTKQDLARSIEQIICGEVRPENPL